MNRIENKRLYTPKLRVKFIGLAIPYFFNDADLKGQYSVTCLGSPEELGGWMDDMKAIREDLISQQVAQEGKKKMPEDDFGLWVDEKDKDTDEPTGMIQIKFKHNARGFNAKTGSKWDIKAVVVDALGKPLDKEMVAKVGRGSVVKVCFNQVAYVVKGKVGTKFELVATQLIKPEWFVPNSREDAFEGQVEEGFSVEEGCEF